jgi:Uma2 family endonuclease
LIGHGARRYRERMAIDDPPRTRRWTRVEYERLVDQGIFREDEHLELLDGLLVVREPQGSRHGAAVAALCAALARAFGAGFHVRPQLPLALDDASEPEPDIVVVRGGAWDYVSAHPTTPLLVVEIAETSLLLDREHKSSLYARAHVADYWIVNLPESVIEVYRQPVPAIGTSFGWQYQSGQRLTAGAIISPLSAPQVSVAVGDLLPPA